MPIKKGLKESAPSIPQNDPVRLELWVKAGGRCEFLGCNAYLLEDELTRYEVNLGEVAHVVGRSKSKKSPRGDDKLLVSKRNEVSNLMLLCPKCHNKIIDNGKLLPDFPVELLQGYKQAHEERIRFLAGMGPECSSVVVKMIGHIRGDSVALSNDEVRKALFKSARRYPKHLGAKEHISIDLSGLPKVIDDNYWNSALKKINEIVDQAINPAIESSDIEHLSIFALARIPLLMYLGYRIGDKVPVDFYQKQRTENEGWSWAQEDIDPKFQFDVIQKGEDPNKVAVLISLSGVINIDQVPIDSTFTAYELKPIGEQPNRNIIRSKRALDSFRDAYELLMRTIEHDHQGASEICFFPAMGVSAALTCGRELMKDVSKSILIYDRAESEYHLTIKIN